MATRVPRPLISEPTALLARAEAIGQLGSWEWLPGSDELRWSTNLYRLFGLNPGAVVPSAETVLALVHPDDRPRVERAVARLEAGAELRELDYRIIRPDLGVRHLRATVAVAEQDGGPVRLAGWVQDRTDQVRSDREFAAHIAVADALECWTAFDEGADRLLAGLGHAFDASIAVLWIPEPEGLAIRALWSAAPERTEALALTISDEGYAPEGSLASVAWERRSPVVAGLGLGRPRRRVRAEVAEAGLRGSLAFPASFRGEILAVVSLAAADEIEDDDRLALNLAGIGTKVGHLLERHREDLAPPP